MKLCLVELSGEVAALNQTILEQRKEIARLKALKGRHIIEAACKS